MKRATSTVVTVGISVTISIHALVKRATDSHKRKCYRIRYFNPRPREEGDLRICRSPLRPAYFNPRPREEGDVEISDDKIWNRIISIHALVKRATVSVPNIGTLFTISIHALVKRATAVNESIAEESPNFNPRPREEGDILQRFVSRFTVTFQSTPS